MEPPRLVHDQLKEISRRTNFRRELVKIDMLDMGWKPITQAEPGPKEVNGYVIVAESAPAGSTGGRKCCASFVCRGEIVFPGKSSILSFVIPEVSDPNADPAEFVKEVSEQFSNVYQATSIFLGQSPFISDETPTFPPAEFKATFRSNLTESTSSLNATSPTQQSGADNGTPPGTPPRPIPLNETPSLPLPSVPCTQPVKLSDLDLLGLHILDCSKDVPELDDQALERISFYLPWPPVEEMIEIHEQARRKGELPQPIHLTNDMNPATLRIVSFDPLVISIKQSGYSDVTISPYFRTSYIKLETMRLRYLTLLHSAFRGRRPTFLPQPQQPSQPQEPSQEPSQSVQPSTFMDLLRSHSSWKAVTFGQLKEYGIAADALPGMFVPVGKVPGGKWMVKEASEIAPTVVLTLDITNAELSLDNGSCSIHLLPKSSVDPVSEYSAQKFSPKMVVKACDVAAQLIQSIAPYLTMTDRPMTPFETLLLGTTVKPKRGGPINRVVLLSDEAVRLTRGPVQNGSELESNTTWQNKDLFNENYEIVQLPDSSALKNMKVLISQEGEVDASLQSIHPLKWNIVGAIQGVHVEGKTDYLGVYVYEPASRDNYDPRTGRIALMVGKADKQSPPPLSLSSYRTRVLAMASRSTTRPNGGNRGGEGVVGGRRERVDASQPQPRPQAQPADGIGLSSAVAGGGRDDSLGEQYPAFKREEAAQAAAPQAAAPQVADVPLIEPPRHPLGPKVESPLPAQPQQTEEIDLEGIGADSGPGSDEARARPMRNNVSLTPREAAFLESDLD